MAVPYQPFMYAGSLGISGKGDGKDKKRGDL